MSDLRLALCITEVKFKNLPPPLRDPFATLIHDFDPTANPDMRLEMTSEVRLKDDRIVLHFAPNRALVRADNPEDDDEAVAKILSAWERVQERLALTDLARASMRIVLIDDHSDREFGALVADFRNLFKPLGAVAEEAANLAIVIVLPYEGGRRRLHISPGEKAHLQETYSLDVDEQVFYSVDSDHIFGSNLQFSSVIRRQELAVSIRESRRYAHDVLDALRGEETRHGA